MRSQRMSAQGYFRKFGIVAEMSGLPSEAEIVR
jgi:hypothetical protein